MRKSWTLQLQTELSILEATLKFCLWVLPSNYAPLSLRGMVSSMNIHVGFPAVPHAGFLGRFDWTVSGLTDVPLTQGVLCVGEGRTWEVGLSEL